MKNLHNNVLLSSIIACYLVACNSGSSGNSSTPIQAYISDFSQNAISQCTVTDGVLSNCVTAPIESNLFNNPVGIAIDNGYLYINNSGFGIGVESSVVECKLNGITPSNCKIQHPKTQSGDSVLYYPIGITFYNNYVYIANWGMNDGSVPPTYAQCPINNNSVNWENCTKVGLSTNGNNMPADGTPEVVVFNNGYGYITTQQNDGYVKCNVKDSNGLLNNCQFSFVDQLSAIKAVGPRSMMFLNGYAYFVNSGYHGGTQVEGAVSSYTQCKVNTNGSLSPCKTLQIAGLNSPTALVAYNGYVYMTNEQGPGYSYTQCTANQINGELENCTTYVSGSSNLLMPAYTYLTFN